MSDAEDITDVVEDLAARVQKLEAKRDQVLEPTIDRHEQTITTLTQRVDELETENRTLRAELDSLGELGADADSTPKKRVLDLRKLLLNKAEADYNAGGDGNISWTYSKVTDGLESNGHGKVYAAQAYDAMEAAAEADGFGHGENDHGERVVRVSWERLPTHSTVNEINNGAGESQPAQPVISD